MELLQYVLKCMPNLPPAAVRRPVHHYIAHHVGHLARRSIHHIVAHAPTVFGQTCRYVPIALGIGATALVPPTAVPAAFAPAPVALVPADSGYLGVPETGNGLLAGGGFFASPGFSDTDGAQRGAPTLGDEGDVSGDKLLGGTGPTGTGPTDTRGNGPGSTGGGDLPSGTPHGGRTGLPTETHGGPKPTDTGPTTLATQSVPEPSSLAPLAAGLACSAC